MLGWQLATVGNSWRRCKQKCDDKQKWPAGSFNVSQPQLFWFIFKSCNNKERQRGQYETEKLGTLPLSTSLLIQQPQANITQREQLCPTRPQVWFSFYQVLRPSLASLVSLALHRHAQNEAHGWYDTSHNWGQHNGKKPLLPQT